MSSSDFCFQIFHISQVQSTNIHAHELLHAKKAHEGDVYWTNFQTKGRGQRGNSWDSNYGKNLLFSLIINSKLEVGQQFYLSMAIANGMKSYLDSLSAPEVKIKWPNDILIAKKKVAGILIENSISGNKLGSSIVGIGLNINQISFEEYPREATSLRLEMQNEFLLKEALEQLLHNIRENISLLKSKKLDSVKEKYFDNLYGYAKPLQYKDENGLFTGVIKDVDALGNLIISKNGKEEKYDFKEVEFID